MGGEKSREATRPERPYIKKRAGLFQPRRRKSELDQMMRIYLSLLSVS